MKKNQIVFTIFIQILAIFFIVKYFVIDNLDEKKLSLIFSINTIWLFLFLCMTKLIISSLFYIIINLISSKKSNFLNITDIFLMGGIINQLLPGIGFVYKFYKLKKSSSISIAEFSISQTIWSLNSFVAYIFLGFCFGFIFVTEANNINILLLFLILNLILIFIFYNRKIFYAKLLKINYLNKIYSELSRIKNILKGKLIVLITIFLFFIVLAFLECIGFYYSLKIFGAENITFLNTSYTYISSSVASVILLVNYFGLFELLLTFSANFIMPSVEDIIFYGVCFRVVNTSALIFVALISSILNYILNLGYERKAFK